MLVRNERLKMFEDVYTGKRHGNASASCFLLLAGMHAKLYNECVECIFMR